MPDPSPDVPEPSAQAAADAEAPPPGDGAPEAGEASTKSSASTVATGIFSSKITGLIREATFARFFAVGAHGDVLQTAFRIPNLLQNLLGEGTLSAAFIPIYSRMIEEGREREAGRFAGAIFGLLLAVAGGFALLGMLLAPYFVALLAPGFVQDAAGDLPLFIGRLSAFMTQTLDVSEGAANINRFRLAVQTVRIIFPMTAVLVLSAWALGVLNSHRRFFVPYVAPVLWNVAIIAALFGAAYYYLDNPLDIGDAIATSKVTKLLFAACFGALAGGVLQFLFQLPLVMKVIRGFRFSLSTKVEGVREAVYAAGPVIAGRGVYQISAFVDMQLASIAAAGALSALRYAQTLYLLPISLFGLSVAASELPELSRLKETDSGPFLRRVNRSMRQMMLMIVPTMVGYLVLGYLVVGAFYQRGQFAPNNTWLVYLVLGGYTLGIAATAVSRLLQNSFYALSDTKTPALVAVLRIVVSVAVAVPVMFWLDQYTVQQVIPGFARSDAAQPLYLGAVGLAVGASVGAWMEVATLLFYLRRALGQLGLPWVRTLQMIAMALLALVPACGLWWLVPAAWPIYLRGALVVGVYGLSYMAMAWLTGFEALGAWVGRYLDDS